MKLGRLRWRVLVHGLVVVLLMSGAMLVADRLFANRWVAHKVAERRVHLTNRVSVYGVDGALVASSVQPPIPPPPSDEWATLAKSDESIAHGDVLMSAVFRDGVFAGVVARRVPPPMDPYPGPPPAVILLALGVSMVVTLLASIPMARSVVRPVEALARSVERFGSGELSARASLEGGDEIGDLAASFDEMAARIESLVRSEKQILASISHELRTPLARIRVVLELASDGDVSRVRSYLSEIAHDLAELEGLLDDVLAAARHDMASVNVGQTTLPLRWTTANLGTIVEKSRARFASLYPDGKLDLVTPSELPDLPCDPDLLRRVVDNLLDNAAKHAKGSPIELTVSDDAENVAIEVADHGEGMPPEVAARVFEPFFRSDASRDRRTGGVGLGLSIVRSIVHAHGGTVELDTAPGRGTCVKLRIPHRT